MVGKRGKGVTILEVFQRYAKETAAEGKLFNFVLTLCLWVSLSNKNVFEIFSHCLTKEVSMENSSPSSLYPVANCSIKPIEYQVNQ